MIDRLNNIPVAQEGYQIVHSIAGRIRIRISWLETDSQAASNYQRLVEALNGVKAVRINALAHSIVVEYNPRTISASQAGELMVSTMQQVKLTPPLDAPSVENVDRDPNVSEPQSAASESTPEPPHPAQQPINPAEIPSPWDEDPSQSTQFTQPTRPTQPTQEILMKEPFTDHTSTIASTPAFLEQICSTSSLADRLKVTSQAITRRRAKSDFGQWTRAQDPEGIAWNYDEHERVFRPEGSDTEK